MSPHQSFWDFVRILAPGKFFEPFPTKVFDVERFNGAMNLWLKSWISNPGVPFSKALGGSKVNFPPSEDDKMSTRNSWKLTNKK